MISDETFNNIKKCIEFVANAVIQNIEKHLDYINSSLASFTIFYNKIPLRNI